MTKTQFTVIGKNDIASTIACVDCGTKKEIVIDSGDIAILNEFCHKCQVEGVLVI